MKQLQPGVYVDDGGALHINAAEVCRENGYEPNEHNQAAIEAAARDMSGELGVDVDVMYDA